MKDYLEQLRIFSENETREETIHYLEKYWLDSHEYSEKWLPIQNTIFDRRAKYFPDMMFKRDFGLIPLRGGLLFTQDDFALLQECMHQIGDQFFTIIQNCSDENPHYEQPCLRFVYPSDTTWDEIIAGGLISQELFQYPFKEYFVFGDTGVWGKYVANDYVTPLDIIGFKMDYLEIFKKRFEQLVEPQILSEWLPDLYKGRIVELCDRAE